MNTIFINIKQLVGIRPPKCKKLEGSEMANLPSLSNAYLIIEEGFIKGFGTMNDCPPLSDFEEILDAQGRLILPCWCDSHTHLVFSGSREEEFAMRIKGLSYQQIAESGGGIRFSMRLVREADEDSLYLMAEERAKKLMTMGTGALEIKSGYGLDKVNELKILRVVKRLKEKMPIPIKATFLGPHAIPDEFKGDSHGYINYLIAEVLHEVVQEGLADFVDIFCEKGYFSKSQLEMWLEAANTYGLRGKVHVNQFNILGGVGAAVHANALSVDHLEKLNKSDIQALKEGDTIATSLPSCSFFLNIPYTPARQIIDSGLSLALASDYNPGSSPSGNMNLILTMACLKLKMSVEEAINACTLNGAFAMGLEDQVGSITIGKRANIIMTKPIPSYLSIPYSFGESMIEQVYILGRPV